MSYNTKNYTEQGGDTTHIGGKLVFGESASVEGFPLEKAGTNKLGGVKIGAGLSVTNAGVLSAAAATTEAAGAVKMAANQAASTAADVAGIVADLNDLIAKLKTAGIMAPDAAAE